MAGALLDKATILSLAVSSPPLIEGAPDLAGQLQPNGIDLTARDVARYASPGAVDLSDAGRVLSQTELVPFDAAGKLHLEPGPYLITFNEVVTLPRDLAAIGRARSSLLRCGVALHTAVWDAGYSGRSQSLLVVHNPRGFTLQRNARVMQLLFVRLERPTGEGYAGSFMGENL